MSALCAVGAIGDNETRTAALFSHPTYLSFIPFYSSLFPTPDALARFKSPAYGCLMELTIQLAVIMVGKQAINNVVEVRFGCLWHARSRGDRMA